jgi:hypothetical protein
MFFFHTTVLCADPTVYLDQTFPYTTKVDGYPTLVVQKDKDAYLACVVDKKPKGMPVCFTFIVLPFNSAHFS